MKKRKRRAILRKIKNVFVKVVTVIAGYTYFISAGMMAEQNRPWLGFVLFVASIVWMLAFAIANDLFSTETKKCRCRSTKH